MESHLVNRDNILTTQENVSTEITSIEINGSFCNTYIYKETILDYLLLFPVSEICQTNDVVFSSEIYFIGTECYCSYCGYYFIISG